MKVGSCNVVAGYDCRATGLKDPVGICFACGLDVCIACSRRRVWHRHGRKRICLSCIEDDERFDKKKAAKVAAKYERQDKIRETTEDREYWQRYGNLIGARLSGWTDRWHALFILPDNKGSFEMTESNARMVDAAMRRPGLVFP